MGPDEAGLNGAPDGMACSSGTESVKAKVCGD